MASNTITLKFDAKKVQKVIRDAQTRYPKAIARSLNRANVSMRTVMVKHVAADTGLKSATVKKDMTTRDATPAKLTASLEIKGARIPLYEFGARPKEPPSRGRGRGVTARLPHGSGRYPHAFIARMKSGHVGVFERVPGARRHGLKPHRSQLPIYELFGPSLPGVFRKYAKDGLARGQEALIKNLESELRFAGGQTV